MSSRRSFLILCCLLMVQVHSIGMAQDFNFEKDGIGTVPKNWTSAKTGNGNGSVWKIQEDTSSPMGKNVLVQTSSDGPSPLFNLCVANESETLDVNFAFSLKAISGKTDQGGGPIWRYQDENNYYVARANPLENNFRLYKVIDGKRTQLATADVPVATNAWHKIKVEHHGDRIQCSLNGTLYLDIVDESIKKAGRVGFWTKADAVTAFTAPKLVIVPVKSSTSPAQVLVVNTQDASISLVDLVAMKEVSRHSVGTRPYGIAVSKDCKTVEECVKFFSFPDFQLKGKTPIGKMHNDHIVLTQDGRSVMVANFFSDDIVLIDINTMKETARIEGCSAPHVVKYGPLKKRAFVTCKKVTGIAIIDPDTQTLVKFHQLNVNPRSLTFSADESKVYFGSFWVNGFFELDTESGLVTKLHSFDPPADKASEQEVTYHGVEATGNNILLAANEGRSYVDAVDVTTGKLLDRLVNVNKPCCVERIPGEGQTQRVLVSSIGDGTLQLVEISAEGKMKVVGQATVGKAPKRVAFIPSDSTTSSE
jgi:hypothetical protein